jgi:hypothetical protein
MAPCTAAESLAVALSFDIDRTVPQSMAARDGIGKKLRIVRGGRAIL